MVARRLPLTLIVLAALLVLGFAAPTTSRSSASAQEDEAGSLGALLALAPDIMDGPNAPESQIAAYANAAAQFEALGVEPPDSFDDDVDLGPFIGATQPLYFPNNLADFGMMTRELIGFDILQVDQSLVIGEPPFQTTFLRGRFDEEAITEALTANDYEELEVDGHDVLSLSEDERFSLDHPIQRIMFSNINNLVILEDGTVVYASTLETIEAVLAVVAGDAPSLAEREEIATLLEQLPEEPASALVVEGEALRAAPPPDASPDLVATITAEAEQLAPVRLALIGVTPGGPLYSPGGDSDAGPAPDDLPRARFVAVLLMEDDDAAEEAPAVIDERLATGGSRLVPLPFSEVFAEWSVETAADAPAVVVDATFSDERPPNIWIQLFQNHDLGFLAW